MAEGDTRIARSRADASVRRNFVVDDAMVAEFREQLKTDRVRIDEAAFEKDLDFIKAMIRYRIDEVVFGIAEARRHLIAVDPQAQMAMTHVRRGEKLKGLGAGRAKGSVGGTRWA